MELPPLSPLRLRIGFVSPLAALLLAAGVLALGATVYLVNPYDPADWLSIVITVMGGGMVLEGLVILGFGRPFLHFASMMLGAVNRTWALLSGALGIVLVCVAMLRF